MNYITTGVCAKSIDIDVDEEFRIKKVVFNGGCPGNTVGVATLVEGLYVDEAIKKLYGIRCGNKDTSCPDQLARALESYCELYHIF